MLLTSMLCAVAYLMGSASSAIIVCRMYGVADPRTVGSRNPGATNVLRHAGRVAAAITLLGDAGKGVIPVLAGHAAGVSAPGVALIGCAAFLGHLYPVYYGFHGGKGVATYIGVILALDPCLGLSFIAVWLVVARLLRYSSLAALVAGAGTPLAAFLLGQPPTAVALLAAMTALVFWRHRLNIANLVAGTEKKIGQKA